MIALQLVWSLTLAIPQFIIKGIEKWDTHDRDMKKYRQYKRTIKTNK